MKNPAYGYVIAALTVVFGATTLASGCGGSSNTGANLLGDGGVAACAPDAAHCTGDSDCCSASCDPRTNTCLGGSPANCQRSGSSCTSALQCCSLACVGGQCAAQACTADNQPCTTSAQCCGGTCGANGTCTPLNTSCRTSGNACTQNADCCSKLCASGHCSFAASFCIQDGDACAQGPDCCGGVCTIAQGQTLGTCGAPPATASNCNGGKDGSLCNGCGDCCSRLCAPYGPYNVNVCQPAEGCHVDGDLCTKDADCCGAPGSGLPGDGNVHCDIQPGFTVGVCRNPTGCEPEGDVCHYQNYACSISSARADCCAAPGAQSGACVLDKLGVPRCYGGGPCVQQGSACAFDMDCCGGGHCVPDGQGHLVCQNGCSATTGPCTVDADCCSGLHCYVPVGSTSGTCGGAPPPPAGYDGGTPPVTDGGAAGCAFYGQTCKQSSDCCNGIPCTAPGGTLCSGAQGCTCVSPLQ